jgi:predicted enzyme related to lactoylglutathione lyase
MERTRYDHGQPCWADLSSPDPAASGSFYAELFGWEVQDLGPERDHYSIFSIDGKAIAGLEGVTHAGDAVWTDYYNVDDLEALAERVVRAGGTVLLPPTDIGTAGRKAVFVDTTGAEFAGWQAGDQIGAQLKSEPRAYIAGELGTSDFAKTKAFYTEALGWGWSGAETYAEATVNDSFVCGIMYGTRFAEIGRPAPPPDYWLTYFASADVSLDFERAIKLGATEVCPPTPNLHGQEYALLVDPQGAPFGLNTR